MDSSTTRTFRLVLAYNGARFKGWQRGNGRTVQDTLEETVRDFLRDAGIQAAGEIVVNGSGRTDAGVHAEGQVASLVLPREVHAERFLTEVNLRLPSDLTVLEVREVDDRFHARYRAVAKTYRYRIVDGPVGNPFLTRFSWRYTKVLSVENMREAALVLVGDHDFRAFTADKKKTNTRRSVHSIAIERGVVAGGPVLDILVAGDGFLWKQVRTMVGALVAAGTGDMTAPEIATMLDPSIAGVTPPVAPAHGLTLLRVEHR